MSHDLRISNSSLITLCFLFSMHYSSAFPVSLNPSELIKNFCLLPASSRIAPFLATKLFSEGYYGSSSLKHISLEKNQNWFLILAGVVGNRLQLVLGNTTFLSHRQWQWKTKLFITYVLQKWSREKCIPQQNQLKRKKELWLNSRWQAQKTGHKHLWKSQKNAETNVMNTSKELNKSCFFMLCDYEQIYGFIRSSMRVLGYLYKINLCRKSMILKIGDILRKSGQEIVVYM